MRTRSVVFDRFLQHDSEAPNVSTSLAEALAAHEDSGWRTRVLVLTARRISSLSQALVPTYPPASIFTI